MAIYLDANMLWPIRSFTEPKVLALSIMARQLVQEIFVPETAAQEAEEDFRRSLEDGVSEIEKAHRKVERLFGARYDLLLEPSPDIDKHVSTWRRRLEEFAAILPLVDEDARTALEREITGVRPAQPREPRKSGRGARDVAIWLTITRHHAAREEKGFFLARDPKAFSDGQGQLHPDLVKGLSGSAAIRLYEEVEGFIERLGATAEAQDLTLDTLEERTKDVVAEGLKTSAEATHAIWTEIHPNLRYESHVVALHPIEILSQRRYEQGDDAVVLVDSRWEAVVDCCYQERDTDAPQLWSAIQQIPITADAQLFLEEHTGEPRSVQFLSAQVQSDSNIRLHEDGTATIVTVR